MDASAAFIEESRARAEGGFARIRHCVEQLSDADLWWRPTGDLNAIGHLVLHVCGNLRQWIGFGVGGLPDTRDREVEFYPSNQTGRETLLALLRDTETMMDTTLARLEPQRLLDPRTIQSSEQTGLAAIYRVVGHLEGHGMQIVYIARMRLGADYRPFHLDR